jgi:DNA adenine methylase
VRLKDTTLLCCDFEDTVKDATAHDFVFFDSPYAPLTPTSFTDYTKEGFKYEDHLRLADLFKELTNRGCYCMLTNHDTPLIRELYKNFNIEVVDVRRSINRNGNDRKGKEVIITNYNPKGACMKESD